MKYVKYCLSNYGEKILLERYTVVKNDKYYLKTNMDTIRIRLFQEDNHKYCSIGFEDMITFMKFLHDKKGILLCCYRCKPKHKIHNHPSCECHNNHVCHMIDYFRKYIDYIFCNDVLDHIKCFIEILSPVIIKSPIGNDFRLGINIIEIVTEDSCIDAVKIVFDSFSNKCVNEFIRRCCQRIDTDTVMYIIESYKKRLIKYSLGKIDMIGWNFNLESLLKWIIHMDDLDSFLLILGEMEDLIETLVKKHGDYPDNNTRSIISKHDFQGIKNELLLFSLDNNSVKIAEYLLHHDCHIRDIDMSMINPHIIDFDYDIVELLLKELSNNNLLDDDWMIELYYNTDDVSILELLVDYGIDYHKHGGIRLKIEDRNVNPEIVKYLQDLLKESGNE